MESREREACLYTDNATITDLRQRVRDLQVLIESKKAALDENGGELTGADKCAVVRWSNEVKIILPLITAKVNEANSQLKQGTKEQDQLRLEAEEGARELARSADTYKRLTSDSVLFNSSGQGDNGDFVDNHELAAADKDLFEKRESVGKQRKWFDAKRRNRWSKEKPDGRVHQRNKQWWFDAERRDRRSNEKPDGKIHQGGKNSLSARHHSKSKVDKESSPYRSRGRRQRRSRSKSKTFSAEKWKTPAQVGDKPFGKELKHFDAVNCGTDKLEVQEIFQSQIMDKSMGVELQSDQIIICNTFKNEIDFVTLGGNLIRTIPAKGQFAQEDYQPQAPAQCTVLTTGQTVLLDDIGITVFSQKEKPNTKLFDYGTAQLSRKYMTKTKPARGYGLLITRLGQIGTYLLDDNLGHIFVWLSNIHKKPREWKITESIVDVDQNAKIRFAKAHGNTIALSDMSRSPKLWLTDLNGAIRCKIQLDKLNCIQPAGVCFDAKGNVILSDSKAEKIMVFDKDGRFCHEIDVVDKHGMGGYLRNGDVLKTRLTDISLNDKGQMVILCPLMKHQNCREDELFERGGGDHYTKCFLLCKFKPKQVEAIAKERAVKKTADGIFVEVRVNDEVDVQSDREHSQVRNKFSFHERNDPARTDHSERNIKEDLREGYERRDGNRKRSHKQNLRCSDNIHDSLNPELANKNLRSKTHKRNESPHRAPSTKNLSSSRRTLDARNKLNYSQTIHSCGRGWGQSSTKERKPSWSWENSDREQTTTSGWGRSPDKEQPTTSGWGRSPDQEQPTTSGWGRSPDQEKPTTSGWGESSDKAQSTTKGWGKSPNKEQTTTSGWNSVPSNNKPFLTGWGSPPREKQTTKGDWGGIVINSSDDEQSTCDVSLASSLLTNKGYDLKVLNTSTECAGNEPRINEEKEKNNKTVDSHLTSQLSKRVSNTIQKSKDPEITMLLKDIMASLVEAERTQAEKPVETIKDVPPGTSAEEAVEATWVSKNGPVEQASPSKVKTRVSSMEGENSAVEVESAGTFPVEASAGAGVRGSEPVEQAVLNRVEEVTKAYGKSNNFKLKQVGEAAVGVDDESFKQMEEVIIETQAAAEKPILVASTELEKPKRRVISADKIATKTIDTSLVATTNEQPCRPAKLSGESCYRQKRLHSLGHRTSVTHENALPLREWLNDHLGNPYPTPDEKRILSVKSDMAISKVSKWFSNVRLRMKKKINNEINNSCDVGAPVEESDADVVDVTSEPEKVIGFVKDASNGVVALAASGAVATAKDAAVDVSKIAAIEQNAADVVKSATNVNASDEKIIGHVKDASNGVVAFAAAGAVTTAEDAAVDVNKSAAVEKNAAESVKYAAKVNASDEKVVGYVKNAFNGVVECAAAEADTTAEDAAVDVSKSAAGERNAAKVVKKAAKINAGAKGVVGRVKDVSEGVVGCAAIESTAAGADATSEDAAVDVSESAAAEVVEQVAAEVVTCAAKNDTREKEVESAVVENELTLTDQADVKQLLEEDATETVATVELSADKATLNETTRTYFDGFEDTKNRNHRGRERNID